MRKKFLSMLVAMLFVSGLLFLNVAQADEPVRYTNDTAKPALTSRMRVDKISVVGVATATMTYLPANPDRIGGFIANKTVNHLGSWLYYGVATTTTTLVADAMVLDAPDATGNSDRYDFFDGHSVYTGAVYFVGLGTGTIHVIEILK